MPKALTPEEELAALMETLQPLGGVDPYVKCVIFGPHGVGKSTLAATAGKKILWVDGGENGWVSLKNHPELYAKIQQRVPVTSRKVLMVLGQSLLRGDFPLDIDTVILDTATDMVQADLRAVVKHNVAKPDVKGRIDLDPYKPERPDYLVTANRMREAFALFRDAPVNVIWVCQEKSYSDEATNIQTVRPEAPAAIGNFFGQMAHLQARLTATGSKGDDRKRELQVHPTAMVDAKTRIGGLPLKIENPNLTDIFAKWSNSDGSL